MKTVDNVKIGEKQDLVLDPRYFLQTAQAAMKGDVVRGLVELITNADDSYSRLSRRGEIIITIERKRGNKNSTIKVLDKAEGMSMEDMITKLKRVGGNTSGFLKTKGRGVRGIMGRGSRECVIFGKVIFQSIKNNLYSELEIKKPASFIAVDNRVAIDVDRFNLNIARVNGTLVTIEVEPQFKIPSHKFLIDNLPKYYSLRDISSSKERNLIIIDANDRKKSETKLQYIYPIGDAMFDGKIEIPEYQGAEAHLVIKRMKNRISPESNSPYWEGGILIKSSSAIHGITSLTKKIENNPYFEYYSGKVECPYIDDLATDYEEEEKIGVQHSEKNPSRVIDPLRSEGLTKDHPFTKALYGEIAKQVSILLEIDEQNEKEKIANIENEKTKDRFKKLADEVGKFIKEHTEDTDIFEDENYLTNSEIPAGGMIVIPGGLRIVNNKEKKAYVYCRPVSDHHEKHVIISVVADSDIISLKTKIIELQDRDDGVFIGSFFVEGIKEGEAMINLSWGSIRYSMPISVVSQEKTFEISDFQFEKDDYTVQENKIKKIKIFAKWPNFIHGRVKLDIAMGENKNCELLNRRIILDYDRNLKATSGTRFATGALRIKGLKNGGPIMISATLKGKTISTKIRITPRKYLGSNFDIKIVDKNLGDQRAVLVDNTIEINAQHKIIKRYLGSQESDYSGQNFIHFRLLVAELIADTVARRVLELNAQSHPREFEGMDATGFYRKHREFMNAFLECVHEIQIPHDELLKLAE